MDKLTWLPIVLVVLVDWLLILGTDKLFGLSHNQLRAGLAALLGGGHAALCLLTGFDFLNAGIWRLIILAAAGLIAFEMDLHRTAVYCLMNMGLGGLVACLGRGNVFDIVVTAVLICALCFIGFQSKPGNGNHIPVRIPTPNGPVIVTALADTGNSLTDPITGHPVLVASAEIGSRLLGVDRTAFEHPTASILKNPGLRLIPYSTVGGRGLLLAKKFRNVSIGDKTQDVLIAFSPMEIGKGKGFNALTGGSLS